MKKKILVIFIFILLLGLIFLTMREIKFKRKINNLPKFEVASVDNYSISSENFYGKPLVISFFNSECDLCKDNMLFLVQNNEKLKDIQFILISDEPVKKIKDFSLKYSLDKFNNFLLINDKDFYLADLFKVKGTPYHIFYDEKSNLLKTVIGQINGKSFISHKN